MVYKANIPQPTDNLDDSQVDLLGNFQQLDTTYGIDHYAFTVSTANLGFHNKITTPLIVGSAHPATGANPILYAMQDSANVGVIQYSRGPNNVVPSPITTRQSQAAAISLAPNATADVLDFTGLPRAMAILYAANLTGNGFQQVYAVWNGATLLVTNYLSIVGIEGVVAGAVLRIKNTLPATTLNEIRWTLQMIRLE